MKKLFENWRRFTEQEEPNYGYIVGDLQGEIYAAQNEDELFYGASMNKPIIALANLILYKDRPEKQLNSKELRGLLAYTYPYESNDVNRVLSGRSPRKPCLVGKNCCGDAGYTPSRKRRKAGETKCTKREMKVWGPDASRTTRVQSPRLYKKKIEIYDELVQRKKEIGRITPRGALKFLKQHGLNTEMLITYGGPRRNKQSAKSFFEFLSFLHDASRISGIEKEVGIIINHMKREPIGLKRTDREAKKWQALVDRLNEEGVSVKSIYGKGGRTDNALNYGFVINNNIVLSIYTDRDDRKFLTNKVVEILKGVKF